MQRFSQEQLYIIGAFAVIYVIWGSTYVFNYFAIQSIPPFIMGGSRFLVAGTVLFFSARMLKHEKPSLIQWKNAFIIGFMFFAMGVGGVVWAMQFIDTGIASLIVSFEPLLIILLLWSLFGKRPGRVSVLGALLGMAGMALLVGQSHFFADNNVLRGVIYILVSITAWSLASIYISKIDLPRSRMLSAGMQMIAGGVSMFVIGSFIGEFSVFQFGLIDLRAGLSWIYLVLFGSVLAFTCFNFLLVKVSPDKVASCTYVNPVIALILGWILNGEVLTTQSGIAAAVLLSGVICITLDKPAPAH